MSRQDYSYRSMIAPILDFLRTQPGMAFTAEELCQQFACTPLQIRIALDVLVRSRLVRKERPTTGSDRYTWGGT